MSTYQVHRLSICAALVGTSPVLAVTLAFPWAMQVALSKKSPYLPTAHRVSGLMLANHTGVRHLFDRSIGAFDRLMRRKAFIDNYKASHTDSSPS